MPQPHLRTRSKKRSKVTLTSGRNRTHYKMEIVPTPSCAMCGKPLAGISHLSPVRIRKLDRSKRKIWRPYGGQICHNCLKRTLKQSVRVL